MKDDKNFQVLLRNLSHDLRGSLSSVSGLVALVEKQYKDVLDAKALNWLSLIQSEHEKSDRKLRALSRFAMLLESNFELQSIDVGELAAQVLTEKQAHHVFDCTITSNTLLTCCPELLKEYIEQLFENSIEHALSNERPLQAYLSIEPNVDYVEVKYADNGDSLSDKKRDYILGPFRSLKKHGVSISNAGLGLSYLQKVIDIHDGTFSLDMGEAPFSGLCVTAKIPSDLANRNKRALDNYSKQH